MTPPTTKKAGVGRKPVDSPGKRTPDSRRDRHIATALTAWFRASMRGLPWRCVGPDGRRDPYRSLVSEAMLQQTQVSRVAERFEGFIARFPSFEALAGAPEQEVLAAWSGLGYYRRARNLHRAAQAIVSDHGGVCPSDPVALCALPGVGRYTAGALASMVFGVRTALVDANVVRVLLRLEGKELPSGSAEAQRFAWGRAEGLVNSAADPGAFNEGLMELGALVCKPRTPECAACPLRTRCRAHRDGSAGRIPVAEATKARRRIHHAAALIHDARGRVLVEQRAPKGLWAGMWQAPTLERDDRAATRKELGGWLGAGSLSRVAAFEHATTHRLVAFEVWGVGALTPADRRRLSRGRRWATRAELDALPLASAQRRALLA
jgi:A/G-specific adenine glycosylase